MKKKQEKKEGLTIQYLERKYQQQKQILVKQNNTLSKQIISEIQRANQLSFQIQKIQQTQNFRLDQLQRQNQVLRARVLQLQKQQESLSEYQIQTLTDQKNLFLQNQRLMNQTMELTNIIEKIHQQKQILQEKLKSRLQEQKEVNQNFDLLAQKHEKYKKDSQSQIDKLEEQNRSLAEEKEKTNSKIVDQKRKKKELERKVQQLQKITNEIKFQEHRLEGEIEETKRQKQLENQKNSQLAMKLQLVTSKNNNLQKFIIKLEEQIKQLQKKLTSEKDAHQQLKYKFDKICNQLKNSEHQNEQLRIQCKKLQFQVQKSTISKQQIIKAMRRSETEQLIGLIKGGYSEASQKQFQKLSENINRNQGTNLSQQASVNRPQQFQEKQLDKIKLQQQINILESEIGQYRKHFQSLNHQLNKNKRIVQDKSFQIQRKESQIKQLRLRKEKIESDRNKEIISLRSQNQLLKSRQTERLEKAKELNEYEAAVSLKLAFYQRKIKEHLDTIDRKQTIVEKLQMNRNELEDKQKGYEESMQKLSDEVEFLRKFKQDCFRKDELLKQYKSKLEKSKPEIEDFKNELSQLKKDKNRLQKQIQSKDQMISSLKSKQQKQTIDKNEDNAKEHKLKELKNVYQAKLKHLRKQKQDFSSCLMDIKVAIMNKVEQILAKQIPAGKKKTHQYEAAKLLGIKPGELQEFLNPISAMNKKITHQLQGLWQAQNFSEFVNRFISYLENQEHISDQI